MSQAIMTSGKAPGRSERDVTHPDDQLNPTDWPPSALNSLAVICLIALGAALRLHRIDTLPTGLLYDEAYNGVDVVRILAGARPAFLSENFGREPLFIYIQALSVLLLGHTDFALRLPAALVGILTLPLSYLVSRELFGRRVAFFALFFLAISPWHLIFSRVGLRAIMLPLFVSVVLLYYLKRRPILAGVFLGLSLYTYTAARFLPFVLLAISAVEVIGHLRRRSHESKAEAIGEIRHLLTIAVFALVVFAPLGWHFYQHPDDLFGGRTKELSIFNPSENKGDLIGSFDLTARKTLGMFVVSGDSHTDRNVSSRPIFDLLSSVLFLVGLGVTLTALRGREARFLLIWLGVMLLPALLAPRDAPSALRTVGLIPGVFMLPALGLAWLSDRAVGALRAKRSPLSARFLVSTATGLALVGLALLSAQLIFRVWSVQVERENPFGAGDWLALERAAEYLGEPRYESGNEALFVGYSRSDSILDSFWREENPNRKMVRLFDSTRTFLFPPSGQPTTYLFSRAFLPEVGFLKGLIGDAQPTLLDGGEVVEYHLGADYRPPLPQHEAMVRFGDAYEVTGFDYPTVLAAGSKVTIVWYWRAGTGASNRYFLFNQLLDAKGERVAGVDDQLQGTQPLPDGASGISRFVIMLPDSLPTGAFYLSLGVYDKATGERLKAFDARGKEYGDQYRIGPLKLFGENPLQIDAAAAKNIDNYHKVGFADAITLLGIASSPSEARAGETIDFSLYWRAEGRPSASYKVFVHLVPASREGVAAQDDGPPGGGLYPTALWDKDEVIEDRRKLALPTNLAPGEYLLRVGLYQTENGKRLGVLGLDGKVSDDHIDVGRVSVR